MEHAHAPERIVRELLASQRLAVLATAAQGNPYSSLIAFAAAPDRKVLVFATLRATRKFSNLTENARVSLLVDNRGNREEDFSESAAVTILGTAREAIGEERETCLALFLGKHPYLSSFARSPNCAIFRVEVEAWYVANRFQPVSELPALR
jgi:nitroimidazol reductase NimA-like FMN-containing flavoprotein (pyridoxamine 5'-phosphate oxidase superfamily)